MKPPRSIWVKYGFEWVTLALFLISFTGQWAFAWYEYVDEQRDHDKPPDTRAYLVKTARGVFENWQSEFLELLWEVTGLALLFYVGSPVSKDGEERLEEKIDALLKMIGDDKGRDVIAAVDERFRGNSGRITFPGLSALNTKA